MQHAAFIIFTCAAATSSVFSSWAGPCFSHWCTGHLWSTAHLWYTVLNCVTLLVLHFAFLWHLAAKFLATLTGENVCRIYTVNKAYVRSRA